MGNYMLLLNIDEAVVLLVHTVTAHLVGTLQAHMKVFITKCCNETLNFLYCCVKVSIWAGQDSSFLCVLMNTGRTLALMKESGGKLSHERLLHHQFA